MPSPQAITTREELHAQHSRSLQEKDVLRKQVRELAEKADELQLQLFQREGQLLAVEGRLKRQQLDTLVLVGLPGAGGPLWCTLVRAAALPQESAGAWPSGASVSQRHQSPEEGTPGSPGPGLARLLLQRDPGLVPGLPEPLLSSVRGPPPGRPLWVSGGGGRGVLGGGQGQLWAGEGPEDRGWPGTPHQAPPHPRPWGGWASPQPADRPLFCDHRALTWRTAHPGTPRR